jgi:hypothetical protein
MNSATVQAQVNQIYAEMQCDKIKDRARAIGFTDENARDIERRIAEILSDDQRGA